MGYRYNLVPFLEIRRGLENIDKVGYYYVIVRNVVALMPFGFLLPLVSEHKVNTWKAFCGSLLLSLTAESIQLVSKTGAFDVDDLILNTLGGLLGYFVYYLLKWGDYMLDNRQGKRGV